MALHIQMSEEAEEKLRQDAFRSKFTSLVAMLGLIIFGGAMLYFTVVLIAIEQEAEFIGYTPPADDLPPRAVPTTQQLSSKAATPSNTVSPSVIVATGAAPVAMAQVDVPMDDSTDEGMSIDIGMGLDAGLGDSLGDGGAGLGGSAGGSALVGHFYDLKLTKNGAPNGIQVGGDGTFKCMGIIKQFMTTWSEASLAKYFKAPTELYISSFYIPQVGSDYATTSFQVQDKCKPGCWVALYKGKVKAPKTGKFRFLGLADETMLVRFDRKLVLETGYRIPSGYDEKEKDAIHGGGTNPHAKVYQDAIKAGKDAKHKGYEFFQYPEIPTYNKELAGMTAGMEFSVKEGQIYPIEILIGDFGGAFGFYLCMQETTKGKEKPKLPLLFRTNFTLPSQEELKKVIPAKYTSSASQYLKFNEDSPIWVVVP